LDGADHGRDNPTMKKDRFAIHFQKVDASRNMRRFYELVLEDDLLGHTIVVKRWGRIGTFGQTKRHFFDGQLKALEFLLCTAQRKRRRGYVIPCPALSRSVRN
jgi:predicted DNA-binding WGR domain protein